jgi:hypothetical protein
MSSKDDIIKSALKDHLGGSDSFSTSYQNALKAHQQAMKSLVGISLAEVRAAQKGFANLIPRDVLSFRGSVLGGIKLPVIEPFNLPDLMGFKLPNINQGFVETLRQNVQLPLAGIGFNNLSAVSEIIQSMSKARADLFSNIIPKALEIDFARMSGISGVASLAALGFDQRKVHEQIRTSFAGMLTDAFKDALRSAKMNEEAFADVERLVNDKIEKLPRGRISAEGIFMLLLQVLAMLIALGAWKTDINQENDAKEASNTQAVQFTQLMGVLQRIAINSERLVPEQDTSTYYVVERQVTLKLKPNSRSTTITTLPPNQKVQQVQMNHKWIYVQYFDYLEGIPKYGWVNKKYLKRLP